MSKLLTESDFERAAVSLGCDVPAIRAVCEVEAPAGGFLSNGEPRILFEAHHFHRLTGGAYSETYPHISSARWNRALYATGPDAETRGLREQSRLQEAVALDRKAALQSASWGKFQIMGFNYQACGFDALQDFINAMYESEGRHLDAFIGFVWHENLADALRGHRWAEFARRYNGPAYAENQYDVKLAAAWRKWGGS